MWGDIFSFDRQRIEMAFGAVRFGASRIGVVLMDDKELAYGNGGSRNLGSHLQFEDRLGFGVEFGKRAQYSLGVRMFHYSNAGFASRNQGLDAVHLAFHARF